jgi:hypothetical protein
MLKKTRDNSDLDHISWSATDIVSSRAESSCYMALLISAQSDAAVAVLFVFVFARERLLVFFLAFEVGVASTPSIRASAPLRFL